jgi:hypothetical protein
MKPQTRHDNIFTAIRAGFAAVAHDADHVKIRHDRIASYAAGLAPIPATNLFDAQHHYRGTPEGTASYVLALDAVNFGSGYKPLMAAEGWQLVERSIYFTVASRLKQEYLTAEPLTPAAMARVTPDDCRRIFSLPRGEYSDRFARLCAESLSELGDMIDARYKFFNDFVQAHNGSAATLVESLAVLPHFHDVHDYKGYRVPILKRAQIAAADLHLAFAHAGQHLFNDTADVTMFADNAVPHVLHFDGILEYTPDLSARIAAGTYLPAGSAAEIEIRACAGHAVELIAAHKGLRAMDIDHILWHRSAENAYYRNSPTHRTLTHFY